MQRPQPLDRLDELLADHQGAHSDFQMDHFIVVRNNWTLYGQYKQALRELEKRVRGRDELRADRDLAQVDIDELVSAEPADEFAERRNAIELRRKRANLRYTERQSRDNDRELQHFYAMAVALKDKLGELTVETRAAHDEEMWRVRLMAQAAMDLMTTGRLSVNTVQLLMSTPRQWREPIWQQIVGEVQANQNGEMQGPLMRWFLSQGSGCQKCACSPVSAYSNGSSALPLPLASVRLTGDE